jgi:hypothetical protein
MQGAHLAKSFVTKYLEGDIPSRIDDYRYGRLTGTKWNLDNETLPEPVTFLSYEPVALDRWPMVITVAISASNFNRGDYNLTRDPIYNVTYSMRTYVWARATGSEECTLMRDRLITVIRAALLDYPCLKANKPEEYLEVMIDDTSMREEYSDLTPIKGERYLAGAYIGYDMVVREIIARKTLGELDEVDLIPVFLQPDGSVPPCDIESDMTDLEIEINTTD